jgi:hypothetical protein
MNSRRGNTLKERVMETTTSLQAKDLTPSQRRLVTELLHIDLTEGDALTVTLHRPGESDASDRRAQARERLLSLMSTVKERTKNVPEEEIEAAVAEAMQFVRDHPRDAIGR